MNLIKPNNLKLKMKSEETDVHFGMQFGKNLLNVLRKTKGLGLAAVQVGCLKRVFVMHWDKKVYIIINPKINSRSWRRVKMVEGCLSYPGIEVSVRRSQWVDVVYTNGSGDEISKRFEGMLARIFLHEFDHLNGICKVGDK